jgi:hypothetical protein
MDKSLAEKLNFWRAGNKDPRGSDISDKYGDAVKLGAW